MGLMGVMALANVCKSLYRDLIVSQAWAICLELDRIRRPCPEDLWHVSVKMFLIRFKNQEANIPLYF